MDDFERGYTEAAERAADLAHPIFTQHGWTYGNGTRQWVPSCGEIRDTVLRLIRRVGDEGIDDTASGRFRVSWNAVDGVNVSLELSECEPRIVRVSESEPTFRLARENV